MHRAIKYAVLVGAFAMAGVSQASDISETEPNDSVSAPQTVDVPGSLTISAALGSVTGDMVSDLDFYKFYGQEGDVVDVDIDGAWGGLRSFDSYIAIFDSGYRILRVNDDAFPVDPGSTSYRDSRIEKFRLPATGYYIVGVSNFPRYFQSGGSVLNPTRIGNGDYQLIISGVTPSIVYINIDIKPGSDDIAPINPRSKGKIPVALLSSATFDAKTINTDTITFGARGDEPSFDFCSEDDVNSDGYVDLMCHFDNQTAGFVSGDLEGIVRGQLLDGRRFEGRGFLKVVPEKHQF